MGNSAGRAGRKQAKRQPTKVKDVEEQGPLPVVNGFHMVEVAMPPVTIFKPQQSSAGEGDRGASFFPITTHFTANSTEAMIERRQLSHQIFFRVHQNLTVSSTSNKPEGRTLFLCNLPLDVTEAHLGRLFRRCGEIEQVILQISDAGDDLCSDVSGLMNRILISADSDSQTKSRSGYVVFKSEDGCERANQMRIRRRTWSDHDEAAKKAGLIVGTRKYGLAKWMEEESHHRPPISQLQKSANVYIQKFDEMEQARRQELIAKRKEPDEDGFVTVTRSLYRRRLAKDNQGKNAIPNRKYNKKKSLQVVDFYRFQMRESKRNQLAELRVKFEEDKKRIEALKERRKFRPF
ncbi:ribosomal RNA-processing protein 7-domain-containing protein [Zopfochytrium polystomum]|nr:ribosomal RNA-processing protein 7-domain-containing protein [Zopfochytrium polystomum]